MMQVKLEKEVSELLKALFKDEKKVEEFVNLVIKGVITGKLIPTSEVEELAKELENKVRELENKLYKLQATVKSLLGTMLCYNCNCGDYNYYNYNDDWYWNFN